MQIVRVNSYTSSVTQSRNPFHVPVNSPFHFSFADDVRINYENSRKLPLSPLILIGRNNIERNVTLHSLAKSTCAATTNKIRKINVSSGIIFRLIFLKNIEKRIVGGRLRKEFPWTACRCELCPRDFVEFLDDENARLIETTLVRWALLGWRSD